MTSERIMLKLGYKASAEQFGPTELLQFSRLAEEVGFDSGLHQRSFPAMEASWRPRSLFARMAWRARRGYVAHHHRHERADAHLSLPARRHRASLRHARGHVSQSGRPRRRHRGIAERRPLDRHGMARVQGAVRAFPRGDHPHPSALDRGAGDVRRPILSHQRRNHLRSARRRPFRSMSRRPAH